MKDNNINSENLEEKKENEVVTDQKDNSSTEELDNIKIEELADDNVDDDISKEEKETTENNISKEEKETTENNISKEEKEITENDISNEEENNQVINEDISKDFSIKKKNKSVIIIAIIAILVLALCLLYKFIYNPKKLFIRSINKQYTEVENYLDDLIKETSNKKAMTISNDLEFNVKVDESISNNSTNSLIDEINKLKLNSEIGYDKKNKQMLINVNALYEKDSIINLITYVKDKNLYLELKDLFDKYIIVPVDDYDSYFKNTISESDIKYILKKTKDVYINNLDEKNFKKSNETIKIDGKDTKVSKISYEISQKEAYILGENILKELKNDSKYIEALATISNEDKETIKKAMEKGVESLQKDISSKKFDSKNRISFVTYVKGITNKSVGYEVLVNGSDNVKISYTKGDNNTIKVVMNNEEILNAQIYNDKIKMSINVEDKKITFDISKKVNGKKTTYDYDLNISGMSVTGNIIVDMKKENKDGSYEAEVDVNANVMGLVKLNVKNTSKAVITDELKLPDLSNSINYEKLTDEDINNIKSKLYENKAIKTVIEKFSKSEVGLY